MFVALIHTASSFHLCGNFMMPGSVNRMNADQHSILFCKCNISVPPWEVVTGA